MANEEKIMKSLNGHKVYDEEAREEIRRLSEQIADLEQNGTGGGGSGGQPVAVKTADSMTNTEVIYIYMGDGETVNGVVYEKGYISRILKYRW